MPAFIAIATVSGLRTALDNSNTEGLTEAEVNQVAGELTPAFSETRDVTTMSEDDQPQFQPQNTGSGVDFQRLNQQLSAAGFTTEQTVQTQRLVDDLLTRNDGTVTSLVPAADRTIMGDLYRVPNGEPIDLEGETHSIFSIQGVTNETLARVQANTLPCSQADAFELELAGLKATLWQDATAGAVGGPADCATTANPAPAPATIKFDIVNTTGVGPDQPVTDGILTTTTETWTIDIEQETVNGQPIAGSSDYEQDEFGPTAGVNVQLDDSANPSQHTEAMVNTLVTGTATGDGVPVHLTDLPAAFETATVPSSASFNISYIDSETSYSEPVTLDPTYRALNGDVPISYDYAIDHEVVAADNLQWGAQPPTEDFVFWTAGDFDTDYDISASRTGPTGTTDQTANITGVRVYNASNNVVKNGGVPACGGPSPTSDCATVATGSPPAVSFHEPTTYYTLSATINPPDDASQVVNKTVVAVDPYQSTLSFDGNRVDLPAVDRNGFWANETVDLNMDLLGRMQLSPVATEVSSDPSTSYTVVDGAEYVDSISGTTLVPNESAFDDELAADVTVRGTHTGYPQRTYQATETLTLGTELTSIDRFELAFDVEAGVKTNARTEAAGDRIFQAFENVSDNGRINDVPLPVPTEGDAYDMQADASIAVPIEVIVVTADGKRQAADADALRKVDNIAVTLDNRGINHTLDRSAMATDGLGDALLPSVFGEIRTINGEPHYVTDRDTYSAGADISDADSYVGSLETAEAVAEAADGTEYFNETALDSTDYFGSPESMATDDLLPADIRINGTIDVEYSTGPTETFTDRAQRPAHAFTYNGYARGQGNFTIDERKTPKPTAFEGNGTVVIAGVNYELESPVAANGTASVLLDPNNFTEAMLTEPFDSEANWTSPAPGVATLVGDGGWDTGVYDRFIQIPIPAYFEEEHAAGLFDDPSGDASEARGTYFGQLRRYESEAPPPAESGGTDEKSGSGEVWIMSNGVGGFVQSHDWTAWAIQDYPIEGASLRSQPVDGLTLKEGDTHVFQVVENNVEASKQEGAELQNGWKYRPGPEACKNTGYPRICTTADTARLDFIKGGEGGNEIKQIGGDTTAVLISDIGGLAVGGENEGQGTVQIRPEKGGKAVTIPVKVVSSGGGSDPN